MNAVGALQSFQLIGVSPGAGGNPRAFIKLNGDKTSLVVRLLFNWNQKRLTAWGDNIALPVSAKLLPAAETSFVNFDFEQSQTLRVRFQLSSDGKVEGLAVPSANGEKYLFARKTEKTLDSGQPVTAATYAPNPDFSLDRTQKFLPMIISLLCPETYSHRKEQTNADRV